MMIKCRLNIKIKYIIEGACLHMHSAASIIDNRSNSGALNIAERKVRKRKLARVSSVKAPQLINKSQCHKRNVIIEMAAIKNAPS